MSDIRQPRARKDFQIAVVCALPKEFDAVQASFDEHWEDHQKYGKASNDQNSYAMGRIANHNIVLAIMPGMGKGTSAIVAANFRHSFPNIKLGLVVGICGGVPFFGSDKRTEVLLGDIIISTGVIQYDFGRQYSDKFVRKGALQDVLGRPNNEIRAFLAMMETQISRTRLENKTSAHLAELLQQENFKTSRYPGAVEDILWESTYRHKHHGLIACICAKCENKEDDVCDIALDSACAKLGCDTDKQVPRNRLTGLRTSSLNQSVTSVEKGAEAPPAPELRVHLGLVASGDSVIISGYHRDKLASEEDVIAFEMEGAGVWENFPTVVIKGVSDYADSHKNYRWQNYAAASAAACMKAIVKEWRLPDEVLQPEAGSSVSGFKIDHIRESRGTTRIESKAPSELEFRSRIGKEVDNAYSLLHRRDKKDMKKDLETARQALLKALDGSEMLDSALLQLIYWGLMVSEKELSCYKDFEVQEKIGHVEMAQRYGSEVAKLVSQSCDAGLRVQVTLEQYILMGRKAILQFRQGGDMDKARRLKLDAVNGIGSALKKLQLLDHARFEENVKAALDWQDKFNKNPF